MSTTKFGKVKFLIYTFIFRIFSRGKVVVHVHRGDLFRKNGRYKLSRFNQALFSHCYKVIVLSRRDVNVLSKFSKSPNKFNVLENTVSINFAKMRTSGGSRSDTCKFVFLSNYLEEKGILLLISVSSGSTNLASRYLAHSFNLSLFGSDKTISLFPLIFERIKLHNNPIAPPP